MDNPYDVIGQEPQEGEERKSRWAEALAWVAIMSLWIITLYQAAAIHQLKRLQADTTHTLANQSLAIEQLTEAALPNTGEWKCSPQGICEFHEYTYHWSAGAGTAVPKDPHIWSGPLPGTSWPQPPKEKP